MGTCTYESFSGTFIARQSRFVPCGYTIASLSMVLKFLIGPVIMLLVSLAIGMHGTLLHIAVVQVRPAHTYRNALPLLINFFPGDSICFKYTNLKPLKTSTKTNSKPPSLGLHEYLKQKNVYPHSKTVAFAYPAAAFRCGITERAFVHNEQGAERHTLLKSGVK